MIIAVERAFEGFIIACSDRRELDFREVEVIAEGYCLALEAVAVVHEVRKALKVSGGSYGVVVLPAVVSRTVVERIESLTELQLVSVDRHAVCRLAVAIKPGDDGQLGLACRDIEFVVLVRSELDAVIGERERLVGGYRDVFHPVGSIHANVDCRAALEVVVSSLELLQVGHQRVSDDTVQDELFAVYRFGFVQHISAVDCERLSVVAPGPALAARGFSGRVEVDDVGQNLADGYCHRVAIDRVAQREALRNGRRDDDACRCAGLIRGVAVFLGYNCLVFHSAQRDRLWSAFDQFEYKSAAGVYRRILADQVVSGQCQNHVVAALDAAVDYELRHRRGVVLRAYRCRAERDQHADCQDEA